VAALADYGRHLGLAFQLVDDVLGIWGDPAVTGKSVHSDLRNRKKSIPVVAALNSGTPAGAELATLYHREQPLSDSELAHVADLVELAGGRSWSQLRADELLAESLRHLATISPEPGPAGELTALASLVTRRDH
jgi:geranylgeranyl diphosphate synthase type I